MSIYLLHHHEPDVRGVVFASVNGHRSPLRHRQTLASCRSGGHAIWWTADIGRTGPMMRMSSAVRIDTAPHVTHREPAIDRSEKGERQ